MMIIIIISMEQIIIQPLPHESVVHLTAGKNKSFRRVLSLESSRPTVEVFFCNQFKPVPYRFLLK